MNAISAKKLRVQKGEKIILDSINIELGSGQLVGLIGPSGSGKTTFMRTLVGVQKYEGTLDVFGVKVGKPELRIRTGYSSQAAALYGDISVRDNLKYFASVVRVGEDRIDEIIDKIELSEFSDRVIDSLSGGQRARVNLAVALLGNPDLLVLDEPTVGLDPILRNKLWKIFRKLAADGKTIIVSSHVMDEADRCDEVVLLRDGKVLWNDSRKALLAKTKTDSVGDAFVKIIEEASDV